MGGGDGEEGGVLEVEEAKRRIVRVRNIYKKKK